MEPCCQRRLAAIAAVILLMGMTASAQSPSIVFDGSIFKVTGLKSLAEPPSGWGAILAIYAGAGDVPPMLGTYGLEPGALTFHPGFPIAPGVRYRVVLRLPGAAPVEKVFDGPPRETTPQVRVVQIYPSGDVLPSNQLRLYIYFSNPMSRGVAAQYIHVLDENGKALQGPESVFLRSQELWDPAFRRLTMTFDPGRIKRGLTSNQTIGPPIMDGKGYTLVVDREWPDAR